MTNGASPVPQRAIYDEDLQARMDAAMVRTRRFINSTQAVRATVRSPSDLMPPFLEPTATGVSPCPKCGPSFVVPLHAVRLREGARCYACKKCGHVFGAAAEEKNQHC